MGESLEPGKLPQEETKKFGNYSPGQIASIVNASLLTDPENSALFRCFIDEVHFNEQFLIQLVKVIQPRSSAFFENIRGICETRIKESEEEKQMKESENDS